MAESIKQGLLEKIDSLEVQVEGVRKKINWIVFYRFLSFFIGLALGLLLFRTSLGLAIGLFVAFLIVFFYTVKVHERYKSKRNHLLNLIAVLKNEINISDLNLKEVDSGAEFLNTEHHYMTDLDIFGENSMFQLINRTSTFEGRDKLADQLKHTLSREEILKNQKATQELTADSDFRFNFQAIGRSFFTEGFTSEDLYKWFRQENYFSKRKGLRYLSLIFPGLTISLLILALFGLSFNFFLIAGLLQLFISSLYLKKINAVHSQISRKFQVFESFSRLFEEIENRKFESEKLLEIQTKLKLGDVFASREIKKLANLIRYLDNRLNMLATLILNGLLLWDINLMYKIENWKMSTHGVVDRWFDGLADFEAVLSKAGFAYLNPEFIYPELYEKEEIKAHELGHPLIQTEQRITNNFEVNKKGEVLLITGSNMAGKSTYLRTVGFNMVLAMMGCPVAAKSFSFFPIQILSSMRVKDNLVEKESTFYAELKRLKNIIDFTKEKQALILLDEILKGTNSKDKLTGSFALVRQLVKTNSMAVIATHDLDLSVLENEIPEKVSNYNFEVNIKNGEFYFDYKLKDGVCKVLNATELMRTMGIEV
jgi:DNA mismatch repair ATPase MutS